MLQPCIGEIAEHCCRRGELHCQRVVRALPGIELRRVTAGAGLPANESGRLIRADGHRRGFCQHAYGRNGHHLP
jgi:hypothetical protein